ncbi:MAG: HesA/MoeB/ThiF family protein, partial [Alkalispirochaeta sp.]
NPDLTIHSRAEAITEGSFLRSSSVWRPDGEPVDAGRRSAPPDASTTGTAPGAAPVVAPAPAAHPGTPPFVLFDCLDSFAARSELDAIRRRTGCTVFHGGVEGWYGQATTFPGDGPGYADAFGPDFADTPAAAKPILPTTVAVIAALQVSDFFSLCTNGSPTPLTGTLAVYDGRRGSVERLEYRN